MSCGPAEAVGNLVNDINGVVDSTEAAIAALPKGIASIPGYAEVQMAIQIQQDLKRLKELIDDPVALVEASIPSLPQEFQNFIEAGNSLVGTTLASVAFLANINEKYSNIDIGDPAELLQTLNDLSGDINKICEIIPNVQTRYGELIEKGKPVTGSLGRPLNVVKQVPFKVINTPSKILEEFTDGFDVKDQKNSSEVVETKTATEQFLESDNLTS